MPSIDLEYSVPETLAESASLDDLRDALKAADPPGERAAEVLDYVYRFRLLHLIRTEAPEEDLRRLYRHLEQVCHPRRLPLLDSLSKPYGSRWLTYMELIDSRLAALSSPIPQRLLKREHVGMVLELVASGRASTRRELRMALKLKEANLNRVLDLMEAGELIRREKRGREIVLHLGAHGRSLSRSRQTATPPDPRGIHYLSSSAA